MKLLEVIPIARGIGKETLSYFSTQNVASGSIVHVPLRNCNVPALVVGVRDAAEAKSELRSLPYPIKKVSRGKPLSLFLPAFVDAVHDSADYFATTTGAVFAALVPKILFQKEGPTYSSHAEKEPFPSHGSEIFILHADDKERFARYRSHTRESFARNESVFLLLPTREDTERYQGVLDKGIEVYTVVLNGSLSPKEIARRWKRILETKHPVLIIATGSFLCISREDIGTYILEKENSRAYKSPMRPFLDVRTFVEILNRRMGARLIMGGTLLRAETIARYKNDELFELAPPQFRLLSCATQRIIEMKKPAGSKKKFTVIHEELARHIRDARANNHHLFLFALRRGMASVAVCDDCGAIVVCKNCATPIMLQAGQTGKDAVLTKKRGNVFLCRACGLFRDALERCATCGSWKLTALGVGIERVEEEIKNLFPEAPLFRMDSDSIKTPRQVKELVKRYYETPGAILIGTEMALNYLHTPVEHSAIVSLDSLFAIPDFRAYEKVYDLIVKIRTLTTNTFLIQTRQSGHDVLHYAISGNTNDFYRNELAIRKRLSYPPFVTLIKISVEGIPTSVRKDMEHISTLFASYSPQVFPGRSAGARGKILMHALIRVPAESWPDPILLAKLRSLPMRYTIDVDPESVL